MIECPKCRGRDAGCAQCDGTGRKPYPASLRGYGNQPLKKPRALRGSKLGAANNGRVLSPDETAAIEAQLRQEGKLG
jgi:hypothetical protein